MKILMSKHGVICAIEENEKDFKLAAGWQLVEEDKAGEEIIRLKPPVKTKATVRALDEANINKGDE